MKIISITICMLGVSLGFSQSFVSPIEAGDIMSPIFTKSATAIYDSGEEIVGDKFTAAIMTNGAISSFTLRRADNQEKVKFKAADLKELRVYPKEFVKFMMAADDNSIKASFENYFVEGGKDLEYILYERVEIKEGKFKLMQLLNPGFDERIKVYLDPNAQEMGSSGEDKSFFVQKGDRFFKLKKSKYDNEFENLYGDSEIMMKFLADKQVKAKFKDFAGHISLYNQTFSW